MAETTYLRTEHMPHRLPRGRGLTAGLRLQARDPAAIALDDDLPAELGRQLFNFFFDPVR